MKRFFKAVPLLFAMSMALAQDINQEIEVPDGQPFLVGQIEINALNSSTYKSWYRPNYEQYQVDTKTIASVKEALAQHKILLFMGTWCGDSKREVPRFIKILEAVDFTMDNLKIVALDKRKDHYKKSPGGEEWGLNIQRVPTFIFIKNGKEVNRIIESPITSLETDIKGNCHRYKIYTQLCQIPTF